MKKFFLGILILGSLFVLGYLILPNPPFPSPPSGSLQSNEPADTETPFRKAYFTDYSRQQVLDWYKSQFRSLTYLGFPVPSEELNYPPEEAQTIIRDQTRSTFLEELVHPLRESVYINGFEPTSPKDVIIIQGRHYRQKITIKYVPSSSWLRILVFSGIVGATVILFREWKRTLKTK